MIDNDVDRRKSAQSFAWVLFFLLSAVIEVPQLVEDSPEMAKLFVRHVEFRESGFIPIPRLALDAEFKNVIHPVSDSLTETIFLMLRSVTEINFPVLSQMDDLMEHLIVIAFFGSSSKALFNFAPRELLSITQAKFLCKRLFRVLLKSFPLR